MTPTPKTKEQAPRRWWRSPGLWLLTALTTIWVVQAVLASRTPATRTVAYSELAELVRTDRVAAAEVRPTELLAELRVDPGKPKERVRAERLPGFDDAVFLADLRAHHVQLTGSSAGAGSMLGTILGWLLPFLLMAGFYSFLLRRMGGQKGPLGFGRSSAKVYDAQVAQAVSFQDLAGVDEAVAELEEVVDFLRRPDKYRALGAHIPKGVLLVGPPGTGKTLLARAVAGEAQVPFFSITGSEFVEMFVGVGAARVRDLFARAKESAPCLVFIDEIDTIGRARGGLSVMATHDEREQTLNQLLAEMDGFDPHGGVILMAATNRPEVLDPALLRAGRFDRQVLVDRPDVRGREAILRVHARKVTLEGAVDLALVAQRTPGMVGADLANLVNEAALSAARRGSKQIGQADFERAIDRLQLGLEKKGRVMRPDEKRRVAYHESGHALTALSLPHADPVHKVTIIPRSIGALGATLQVPAEDRYLLTRSEIEDRLCVLLGGRAAEQLIFGEPSSGAEDDLERATQLARRMVCRFGMSDKLGARTYDGSEPRFLLGAGEPRELGDDTARAIDAEVRALVDHALDRAASLLASRRDALEAVARRLLEVETLERQELESLAHRPRAAA